jgi:hypothetical protein
MVGINGDRAGQLGESGEYWMGRKGSGLIRYSELQGGRPCLRWLRIDRLAPVSKFELCTSAYGISWGPANWVASCVAKTKAILPYLMGVHRDSAWVTHSVSAEAYAWKMCTRVRWALIISLVASWTVATHFPSLFSCVLLLILYPCKVDYWFESPRLPWDVGNTCPLQSFSRIINFTILWWYLNGLMTIL